LLTWRNGAGSDSERGSEKIVSRMICSAPDRRQHDPPDRAQKELECQKLAHGRLADPELHQLFDVFQ